MPAPTYTPIKRTIGDLLSNHSPAIRVPEYQRDYSWQGKHVTDFWQDLIDFERRESNRDGQEYFFGTVVMVNNGRHSLVLDGQQRLATTTVLLSVLRDRLRKLNRQAADFIQNTFIAFENPLEATGNKTYKLELNVFDNEFFRRTVQEERGETSPRPTRRSHKLILDAKRRLESFVDSALEEEPTDASKRARLQKLSTTLTQRFGLVVISSDDQDHASSIFETLNDRGMGLSTADLLRSWILSSAPKSAREEIVRLWDKIGSSSGEQKVEGIIRTSWLSIHGNVKTRALYKEIKDHLQSHGISSLQYTRNLCRDAEFLRDLYRGRAEINSLDHIATELSALKATAGFACILAARNSLDDEQCRVVGKAVLSLAVRHNVLGRRDGGQFEIAVYESAKAISTSCDLEAGLAPLRAVTPSNDELRVAARRLSFPPQKNRIAQVLLRGIENAKHKSAETFIAPRTKVHLEHIYPQRPAGKRSNQHERIVYLLGNLTLLGKRLNQSASNAGFGRKKRCYAESELSVTRELLRVPKWGAKAIRDRHLRLLEDALRIWPASLN